MSAFGWGLLGVFGTLLSAAFLDLVSEEVRGWLDLAPEAILRLAAARLDPEVREVIYQEEWRPELIYVLRGAESRPITRLISGISFACGLFLTARRIGGYQCSAITPATELPTYVSPGVGFTYLIGDVMFGAEGQQVDGDEIADDGTIGAGEFEWTSETASLIFPFLAEYHLEVPEVDRSLASWIAQHGYPLALYIIDGYPQDSSNHA